MSSDATTKLTTRDSLIQGSIKIDSGTLHWNFSEHKEAITSRPLLQNVIGCLAKSGGKRLLHLSMSGKHARETGLIFEKISTFLTEVSTATQLKPEEKWVYVLKKAFQNFLKDARLLPVSDGTQLLLV